MASTSGSDEDIAFENLGSSSVEGSTGSPPSNEGTIKDYKKIDNTLRTIQKDNVRLTYLLNLESLDKKGQREINRIKAFAKIHITESEKHIIANLAVLDIEEMTAKLGNYIIPKGVTNAVSKLVLELEEQFSDKLVPLDIINSYIKMSVSGHNYSPLYMPEGFKVITDDIVRRIKKVYNRFSDITKNAKSTKTQLRIVRKILKNKTKYRVLYRDLIKWRDGTVPQFESPKSKTKSTSPKSKTKSTSPVSTENIQVEYWRKKSLERMIAENASKTPPSKKKPGSFSSSSSPIVKKKITQVMRDIAAKKIQTVKKHRDIERDMLVRQRIEKATRQLNIEEETLSELMVERKRNIDIVLNEMIISVEDLEILITPGTKPGILIEEETRIGKPFFFFAPFQYKDRLITEVDWERKISILKLIRALSKRIYNTEYNITGYARMLESLLEYKGAEMKKQKKIEALVKQTKQARLERLLQKGTGTKVSPQGLKTHSGGPGGPVMNQTMPKSGVGVQKWLIYRKPGKVYFKNKDEPNAPDHYAYRVWELKRLVPIPVLLTAGIVHLIPTYSVSIAKTWKLTGKYGVIKGVEQDRFSKYAIDINGVYVGVGIDNMYVGNYTFGQYKNWGNKTSPAMFSGNKDNKDIWNWNPKTPYKNNLWYKAKLAVTDGLIHKRENFNSNSFDLYDEVYIKQDELRRIRHNLESVPDSNKSSKANINIPDLPPVEVDRVVEYPKPIIINKEPTFFYKISRGAIDAEKQRIKLYSRVDYENVKVGLSLTDVVNIPIARTAVKYDRVVPTGPKFYASQGQTFDGGTRTVQLDLDTTKLQKALDKAQRDYSKQKAVFDKTNNNKKTKQMKNDLKTKDDLRNKLASDLTKTKTKRVMHKKRDVLLGRVIEGRDVEDYLRRTYQVGLTHIPSGRVLDSTFVSVEVRTIAYNAEVDLTKLNIASNDIITEDDVKNSMIVVAVSDTEPFKKILVEASKINSELVIEYTALKRGIWSLDDRTEFRNKYNKKLNVLNNKYENLKKTLDVTPRIVRNWESLYNKVTKTLRDIRDGK